MARYNPSIASGAKSVPELLRSITAENQRIALAINAIPEPTSGSVFPPNPRLAQEFYLTAVSGTDQPGWYKYGPEGVGWVMIG